MGKATIRTLKELGAMPPGVRVAHAVVSDAPGAWPNGTRVVKVKMRVSDKHPIGAKATVLGSVGPIDEPGPLLGQYGYCVEWDDLPGLPVFILDDAIAREGAA